MAEPIDELRAIVTDLATRMKAMEDGLVTAAHTETQSLITTAHAKIDAATKAASDEFALIKSALVEMEKHVTTTVSNALHSPLGLVVGGLACGVMGAAAFAVVQHFIG